MASISSLSSSSSSSSIYGNRSYNIISGLASGLDTEELISGLVQSYQQKIQTLQNKNTKIQWQQEAIQSISDKLVEFDRNYSSYVYSDTNLASSSFFNNAVKTTTNGTYADLISASGKSSSDIVINAVTQLATAARYTVSGNDLNKNAYVDGNGVKLTGESKVDLNGKKTLSKLSGSLTLNYGSTSVTIDFSDTDIYADDSHQLDAEKFQKAIEEKLSQQQITTSSGSLVNADTLIGVNVQSDGTVSFSDKSGAGNSVSIGDATGNLAGMIDDLNGAISGKRSTFKLSSTTVSEETNIATYLAGKSITVSLDGKSKTINLPSTATTDNGAFITSLNNELTKAFGSGKVTAEFDSEGKLAFNMAGQGSTLSVTASNSGVGEILGIDSGLTSYLDTSKTLKDLNIDLSKFVMQGTGTAHKIEEDGKTYYLDDDRNLVNENNERIDENGNLLYSLEINGTEIGTYTENTELNTIINAINSNTEAGVNVSYSKITGQFVFTAKDTGNSGRIEIREGSFGAALFGATASQDGAMKTEAELGTSYSNGTDATIIATINGQAMELTRSSNAFDLDGMNVTVNGTFNQDAILKDGNVVTEEKKTETLPDGSTTTNIEYKPVTEKVTFTSKTDADTIVDAVKKMVDDMNTIIKEVKNAYSTMPLEQSDGSSYEPLSDEDMADMSESAIKTYEDKAKTGILFMDSDLSSLYNDLRNAITSAGADGVTLRSIGISTSYSDGLTTLTFDEKTFREALESDPDKVQEAFTKSTENGAATNGLMASFKKITDKYAATTGDVKGTLIEKAGSQYSPTAALDNTLLNQMEDIEDQISDWQDKMSDQVDYYTNKFTQLELLMNQMNSQSSALSGLMGG